MKNELKDYEMIILTKNFGYNYTGATRATHEYVKRWSEEFSKVIVLCKNLGLYEVGNIEVQKFKSIKNLAKILVKKRSMKTTIFYSDDHFGFILGLFKLEYYHTYHGNWPYAKNTSVIMYIKSFYFRPLYFLSIKLAKGVINVSYFMDAYVRKINSNTVIIRNGICNVNRETNLKKDKIKNNSTRIIMVGNIDERKYKLSLKLFDRIEKSNLKNRIKVCIYGRVLNEKLRDKINCYGFVGICGYSKKIEYSEFDLFLSTSKYENLSIAACEAISNNIPVITFNVGGLNEVIINGVNGIVVPSYSIKMMISAILNYKNLVDKHFLRDDNLQDFNWDLSAKRYIDNFFIWMCCYHE